MTLNLTALFAKRLLPFFTFLVLSACNNPDPTPRQTRAEPGKATTLFADTSFARAFERLTAVDSASPGFFKALDAEINDQAIVKMATDSFYNYASGKLGITTAPNSDPRLNLGMTFKGEELKNWISKMDSTGATVVKIEFGVYNKAFLEEIGHKAGESEYDTRNGRLMVILVAYDKDNKFVGAYNLGGMQP
jgi:hypothetical protein